MNVAASARTSDLVSVVIPAFNAQDWISETLKSVLLQTYENIEVIVIDDGSTDRTLAITEMGLQSSPFSSRVLVQNNLGVCAARNRGWREASGQWIQFLDADDILDPRKIGAQITHPAASGADVVYSDWGRLTYCSGRWCQSKEIRRPSIGSNAVADILLDKNFQQLGSQLFNKRALARVNGFDEACALIEDVELCLRLAIGGATFTKVETDGPIFWYRDRPRSLSKSNQANFIEACLRNAKSAEAYLKTQPQGNEALVEAIIEVYFSTARFYAEHDPARFREMLSDIKTLNPKFLPTSPKKLRHLSQIIGYPPAERLAVAYRKLKRQLTGWMRAREGDT
jgi:glycosyltransferase involved in cell wall biosynthesis